MCPALMTNYSRSSVIHWIFFWWEVWSLDTLRRVIWDSDSSLLAQIVFCLVRAHPFILYLLCCIKYYTPYCDFVSTLSRGLNVEWRLVRLRREGRKKKDQRSSEWVWYTATSKMLRCFWLLMIGCRFFSLFIFLFCTIFWSKCHQMIITSRLIKYECLFSSKSITSLT